MEYTLTQIFALVGGTALSLLAVAVLSPRTVSRVTEALLDRVELALARRARGRSARAERSVNLPIFDSYRRESAHH